MKNQKLQESQEQKNKTKMVDEEYLQRAVQIRRKFLKVNNNMQFYVKRVDAIVSNLDEILKKLDVLQEQATNQKSNNDKVTAENAAFELKKIIEDLEIEGTKLDSYIQPLNKEVEKLALEEQELYRQIKEKCHHLTDDQIIESVKQRLNEENLLDK